MKLRKKAFTLIEVVISVTLMALVMVAVAGLILSTLFANQRNIQTVQALGLAQEGLEVMRYIRDSNWLQNYAWDQGQDEWGANFGETDELYLQSKANCPPCWGFGQDPEVVQLGTSPEFTRKILVEPMVEDGFVQEGVLKVTALVEWRHHRSDRSVELSTYLTDWQ